VPLNLKELREWPPEIGDLAESVREAAATHSSSADSYRSLINGSTWEGQGADAAKAAMEATARDHDAVAENLDKAAVGMEQVGQDAEDLAEAIKGILDDAADQPVVQINEVTNAVIPPDTSYLTQDYAAQVAAKVADLQGRIAAVLAEGARVDAHLAGAINAASVTEPAVRTASSIDDLLLPGIGERKVPAPGEAAPGPASLDGALEQLAGRPGHQPPSPGDAAAGGAGGPVRLDPAKVEQFKVLARQAMQRDGVPADEIEQRLDAMVAAARQPQVPYKPPQPEAMAPPGFGDGFAERWFDTEQGIKNLLGQGGPGAPGVLESWRDLITATNEQLINPVGTAVGEVEHALDSPSLAYYLGEKSADAAVAAPGLIFGGEGALAARVGALDDLAGTGAIPNGLIDTPTVDRSVSAVGVGGIGEHSGGPGGHGVPGGNPLPFDSDNPLPTARPEFTLTNPVDHLSPELLRLSEQHLTGSGETVLGPYAPRGGGPSYIEFAQQHGASYFDIGDAWNTSTPTQQLAANQHVLDSAIANGDAIKMSVPFYRIDPASFTGAEIRYLEAHGYQRVGDNTLVPPTKRTP